MRHQAILENSKCLRLDEDGPTKTRLDAARCVLQGDGEMLVVGVPWDAATAHPKAGGYLKVHGHVPSARPQLPREVTLAGGLLTANPSSQVTL